MSQARSPVRALVASGAVCVALLAAAGSAGAATTAFPGGGSGFASGVEGWTPSGTSCTPVELLCSTEATHDSAIGNPPGSIVVATTATLNLISLFKGTATWTSPPFTVPVESITGAQVQLDRGLDPGGLIDVQPTGSYVATLTDLDTGTTAEVLGEEIADGDGAFASAAAPVAVVGGHRYQLRIDAEIAQSTLALSLLSGTTTLAFDNVGLLVSSGGGSNGDGKGSDRRSSRSSSLSDRRLLSLLRGATVGPAVLKGKRLLVKVSCPASVGRSCRVAAQGMLNRRRAATAKRTVKLGPGKGKRIALRVKPKARPKLVKRKRLLVREKVSAGPARATVYKQRKLIRR